MIQENIFDRYYRVDLEKWEGCGAVTRESETTKNLPAFQELNGIQYTVYCTNFSY